MICPTCGWDNLPGSEECGHCQQDLTPLDRPLPQDRVERSLMEDPVSALGPKPPVTIAADTTVAEAVQTMLARHIGALLVVDSCGGLLGIFSERDLLTKVAGLHEDLAGLTVGDFMTRAPDSVADDDTLAFALHKMDGGGYRHLPVLSNGQPSGVISVRDLLQHITRLCQE
ncbi:MAG: CBS domain-containing protein [Planctomycetes bacterium]|nr:CBS domain-containing protein [Planctomycetota bacterium]